MGKFEVGQRVTYLRLGVTGTIVRSDAGLGYYIDANGWTWSVPENSLSANAGKRYKMRWNGIAWTATDSGLEAVRMEMAS